MKICDITKTSRSNSLPPSLPVDFGWPALDNHKVSESIDESIGASASNQPPSDPIPPGRQTQRENVEASRLNPEATEDTTYISIQAVDASLVPVHAQTTFDAVPTSGTSGISVLCNYAVPVAQRGRLFARCQNNRRLVQKNGHSNVTITKVEKKNRKYFRDLFTTIMDLKWRYHVIMFISAFIISWLLFGLVWYALAHFSGDLNRPDNDNSTDLCISNVYDFSTAVLYSIETQTTIGYGYRVIGPHCPIGMGLLMAQSCIGIFIQCFITGIVFAKIARPKRRAQTIVFSQHAVICMRDGFYNLIFRVGDLRKTHIIGTSVRALLVKSRLTNEGELIPLCQYPLELVTESSITDSFVFFFWPVTIAHRITPSSPLWSISAETMLSQHFEVIVILEGTVQTSGSLIQIRTSYVPNEIKWGQRLTPLVTNFRGNEDYEIDYSNFHSTTPVSFPDCSAQEYAERMVGALRDVVETDYPASFTSPPVLGKDDSNSNQRTTKNARLQTLFQRNRFGIRPKPTRGKNSARDEAKQMEGEGVGGPSSNQPSLSPPPTYASLLTTRASGYPKNPEPGSLEILTTATIHDETRRTVPPDGCPVSLQSGPQINRAFETSLV